MQAEPDAVERGSNVEKDRAVEKDGRLQKGGGVQNGSAEPSQRRFRRRWRRATLLLAAIVLVPASFHLGSVYLWNRQSEPPTPQKDLDWTDAALQSFAVRPRSSWNARP